MLRFDCLRWISLTGSEDVSPALASLTGTLSSFALSQCQHYLSWSLYIQYSWTSPVMRLVTDKTRNVESVANFHIGWVYQYFYLSTLQSNESFWFSSWELIKLGLLFALQNVKVIELTITTFKRPRGQLINVSSRWARVYETCNMFLLIVAWWYGYITLMLVHPINKNGTQ